MKKGLRREIKNTTVEENERLRVKIKGAGGAKSEHKMHEGEKMRKGRNRGIRRINKGTRAKEENQKVKEKRCRSC